MSPVLPHPSDILPRDQPVSAEVKTPSIRLGVIPQVAQALCGYLFIFYFIIFCIKNLL